MRRRSSLIHIAALALLLATGFASWPVPTYAADALDVVIEDNAATTDYPTGITFDLAWDAVEPVEIVELYYSKDFVAEWTLTLPDVDPASQGSVSYYLDTQLSYIPPGIDVVWRWRLIGESGAIFETESASILWADTRFEWQTIANGFVEVNTYAGNEAFAQEVMAACDRVLDLIDADLGIGLNAPIRIWVYDSKDDFDGTQAPNSEQWIAGIAYLDLHLILAVVPEGSQTEIQRVIQHEVAHQVIHQNVNNPFNSLPTWLNEGIAQIYQEVGQDRLLGMVEDAADEGVLLSIRALNGSFPYEPNLATLAYAESYAIVEFIREEFGDDALAELILAYREGVTHDEAALQALGMNLDDLDRLWRASLGIGGNAKAPARVVSTGDDDPGNEWLGWALASGSLVMGGVAVLALVSAWKTLRRNSDELADDEEPTGGPTGPTGPAENAW